MRLGEFSCDLDRAYFDELTGDYLVTLKVRKENIFVAKQTVSAIKTARTAIKPEHPELTLDISSYKRKRSLNANSYLWVLLDKLAQAVFVTKEDLYRKYIHDYGLWCDVTLDLKVANTIMTGWTRQGVGWLAEKVSENDMSRTARLYYGSSVYNTEQMSRVINAVIDDCKELGIETQNAEEVERLLKNWKPEKIS